LAAPGNSIPSLCPPDEKSLAIALGAGNVGADAWVMDIATAVMSPMTHDGKLRNTVPVWSPDSKRIAASSKDHEILEIEVASGRITPHPKTRCEVQDWSPDGSSVLCTAQQPGHARAFLLPLAAGGAEQTILDEPYTMAFLRLSPDGKYVAYTSYELGEPEVFVAALSPSAPKRHVSTAGGFYFGAWQK
jgi:Tol biopolymer transport system component